MSQQLFFYPFFEYIHARKRQLQWATWTNANQRDGQQHKNSIKKGDEKIMQKFAVPTNQFVKSCFLFFNDEYRSEREQLQPRIKRTRHARHRLITNKWHQNETNRCVRGPLSNLSFHVYLLFCLHRQLMALATVVIVVSYSGYARRLQ